MSSPSALDAYGVRARLPAGWEARANLLTPTAPRVAGPNMRTPSAGEVTKPFFHLANFALPPQRGAFGTGAVERMRSNNMLVVLFEYASSSLGTALFAPQGLPRSLRPSQFHPKALQRILPGQAGFQAFFTEAGRAFSLYVVLGSYQGATTLVPQINQVLGGISISAGGT